MNDDVPENAEPGPSWTEKARDFTKRHKGKLMALGVTLLAVSTVALKAALEQRAEAVENSEEPTDDAFQDDGATEAEDSEETVSSDKPPRNPIVEHDVQGHTRTLQDGRVIDIRPYRRGGSKDGETDLGDEDSGEAAA
ncbi:hypothetical protein [Streptomyces termitum]|uniref:hypothetical protein n=1 Tax=Streptomyces termitum TaxID=67368 RepID=UPI0033B66656